MTNELKPCPFQKEGEVHELELVDVGALKWVRCKTCNAQGPCDSSEQTAMDLWHVRYKRTCHVVSSRDYWDEYERYVTHVGWKLSCGHEAITEGRGDPGDPSSSRPCFCSACGAEVADAD